MDTRNPDRPGAALTPQEEHIADAHANGMHEYGCPDGCPNDPVTGWPPFGDRADTRPPSRRVTVTGADHVTGLLPAQSWTGDGLTFTDGDPTNPDTGRPMGRDQGTVPGARIDAAVTEALGAFWAVIADRFPEAQFGDMAPGDTDPLNAAALDVARIWVMWNVPGGMPE